MWISRSITTVAPAVALTLSFTGCGTSDDPVTKPPKSSTAASPSPAEASVPADWEAASVEIAQLHAPADWSVQTGGKQILTLRAPKNEIGLSPGAGHMSADVYSTEGEVTAALDELAGLRGKTLEDDSSLTGLKRLPNETINGSPFYHFRAESEFTWEDHYGTLVPDADRQVTVVWSFNKSDIDRKGADALIAPIMATYEVL